MTYFQLWNRLIEKKVKILCPDLSDYCYFIYYIVLFQKHKAACI